MSKKIFPSSGNGKGAESSVVTVDENNGNVSVTSVTASYITVDGLNGFAKISSGQISSLDITTAQSGNILQSQGGQFIPKAASLQALGGDLDGLVSNATVVSIGNVTSGTLAVNVGGTGKNTLNSGSLLTLSQANIPPSSGSIITVNSNGTYWQAANSSILNVVPLAEPIAYLYTGSAGTNRTFVWTKPDGCRFIRVICQGGGGGGGAGFRGFSGTTDFGNGGGGGGGGGYSDIIFGAAGIPTTVTITAGAGGLGGALSYLAVAGSGGNSSFGNFIYATGGGGGLGGDNNTGTSWTQTNAAYPRSTGGAGGIGYTYSGGAGGYGAERAPHPGAGGVNLFGSAGGSVVIGGAGGGGGGRLYTLYTDTGNPGGGITSINLAGGPVSAGTDLPPVTPPSLFYMLIKQVNMGIPNTSNTVLIDMPKLACSGGGGGGLFSNRLSVASNILASQGASPVFGSGGGGSGSGYYTGAEYGNGKNGGDGGVGYVLIICY